MESWAFTNGPLVQECHPLGSRGRTLLTYWEIIGEGERSDNFLPKRITVNCWDTIVPSHSNRSDNQVARLRWQTLFLHLTRLLRNPLATTALSTASSMLLQLLTVYYYFQLFVSVFFLFLAAIHNKGQAKAKTMSNQDIVAGGGWEPE